MLIVAGAGSGKTFTMTERIIQLISSGVAPQKILGLTFTKAAATELLTRVSAAVQKQRISNASSIDKGSFDFSDAHADNAFMKPEVYTYDAFFQSIVRQYGLLVGFDPNTIPLSAAGAYQLADQVVHEHLRQALSEIAQLSENTGETGSSNSDANSNSSIDDINSYSVFVNNIVALSDAMSSCMIDKTCTTMDEAADRIEKWDDAFIKHLDEIIERDYPEERHLPDFGQPVGLFKGKTESGYKKWHDTKARDYIANVLVEMREKTRMRSVYVRYVKLFAQKKREMRMAQFSDFTIAAMQLVQRFPWIGEQYRSRFTHVFLDEYQDSSTAQASLIVQLFAPHGVSSNDSSALTAVGDPYQAIYAWRGAAPGAFISFLKQTGASSPLSLSKTVRNPRIVLDVANAVTQPLRAGHYDAYGRQGTIKLQEVKVSELSTLSESITGSFAAVTYTTRAQEIDGVVRYAKKAIEKSRQANDRLIAAGKPARSGPFVAVLLRSKTHMREFADALTDAGISVQVDGVQSALDRPDARDIINFLHVISDHANSDAMLNLLASTRYAMSARDLRALSHAANMHNSDMQKRLLDSMGVEKPDRNSWALPPVATLIDIMTLPDKSRQVILDKYFTGSSYGRQRIEECAQQIAFVQSRNKSNLEDIIRATGKALGVDIDVAVAYAISYAKGYTGKAQPVASTDSIVELAQTYENELSEGQKSTLSGFLAWLDSGMATSPDNPTLIGSAQADVTICTVHHSKGLEWDSVIIPEINNGTFPSNQGSHLSFEDVDDAEAYEFGRYSTSAQTWVTDSTDVPYPVRVDKDAVAHFADIDEFSSQIPDGFELENLVDGKVAFRSSENLSDIMSLREESGQTVLEDERRLIYVAITRARRDVIMMGILKTTGEITDTFKPVGFIPEEMALSYGTPDFTKTSKFLAEAQEYLRGSRVAEQFSAENDSAEKGTVEKGSAEKDSAEKFSDGTSSAEKYIDLSRMFADCGFIDTPRGFFVGDDAFEYASATVGQAIEAARHAEQNIDYEIYVHPRAIDERIEPELNASAAIFSAEAEIPSRAGALRERAELVHRTLQTLGFSHTSDDNDQRILESAQRIQSGRNTSVTAIQREISDDFNADEQTADMRSKFEQLRRAKAIVRPIPNLALYSWQGELTAANRGTVFHAFAQRYFTPEAQLNDDVFAQTKAAIRAEVEAEKPVTAVEKEMHKWKERLLESPFALDDCDGVEVPFAYVPQRIQHAVVGVIDAIFEGEQLGDSPIARAAHAQGRHIRYTVIDWKTGRRPVSPEEIEHKLLQVDMYRAIVATLRGVDIEEVDAALYYVSEEDRSLRAICANVKTAEEIEEIFAGNAVNGDSADSTRLLSDRED
ncbi:UvrD-helicase domain-containing protein [Alloscardovia theropitheci]